ncbi:MAG: mechanosensitive ion channel [Verrucomicrobia bacterium]|nr:mechanosensitive ion channel [Verrucomicrobiota bacterium]MDA1087111.1 mechanosensitive ion channel [Verrucomicrobiota bacterium]
MFTPVQFMLRTVLLIVVAIIANAIAKKVVVNLIQRLAARTKTDWDNIFVRNNVFRWLSHLAPGLVIYYGCLVLYPELELNGWIQRVAMAYMGVILLIAINSALNASVDIYRATSVSQGRPIKGLVQMIQIIMWSVGVITLVALLMNQSPWKFLTGIGALSAVLLLVFKDSILGLVASFQVSANNMVRIGDWIEMPKYGADGDVMDISLNTVKVQNWDKTISTIPTYALVADPVKNWRGMSESGGRRIKRAIFIDMQTVTFCSDEMLDRFEQFEHVAAYLKERRVEVEAYNKEHGVDTSLVINGRRITNLGTFRAYVIGYLRNHPMIHTDDMTFLVRQLAPTELGLPIEIYVFSRDQVWANYESIQADIFDHIIAAVPEFDLAVFQSPTGRDFGGIGAQPKVEAASS